MESQGPPQIESQTLGINDKEPGTTGGPPGWLALAVVAGLFLAAAAVVFVVMYFN